MRGRKTSLKGIAFLFGAVAGFLFGPVATVHADHGGPPPAPICTAEDPVEFLCPCESNKWRSITVESAALTSGGSCENSCTFSYMVAMVANASNYGTYDVLGDSGGSTVTFDAANPSATFTDSSLSVECGESHLFDVSYQAGNCPTSTPDGPGPCSIVSITFNCGPACP